MAHDHEAEARLARQDMLAAAAVRKELLYITDDQLGKRERLMIACKDRQQELRVLGVALSHPVEHQNCNTAMGIVLAVDPMNIHNLQQNFHIVKVATSSDAHRRYDAIRKMPAEEIGEEAVAGKIALRDPGNAFRRGA